MRKHMLAALACLAVLALTAAPVPAADYVNGIDANYPPFAYVDKSGEPAGFDVDSMNWIAKRMGFGLTHKPMDWNTIIPDLLAGKIDMVCSGMSVSPERAARVAFTDPYYTVRKVFVVREKSGLSGDVIFSGNKKLGVQRGTNEAEWLAKNKEKNNWNYELRYYDSSPMAIEDLLNGRIDAAGMDAAPAEDAIRKAGKPVKIAGVFADEDVFAVATRNEDKELRALINEGYAQLKASPYWKRLHEKYLGGGK